MRKILNIIFLLLVLVIPLLSPKAAYSANLFQDNFEDGNDDDWEIINGVWQVDNGQYKTRIETPFTLAETQAGNYSWTDYEFEVDLSVIAGRDRNLFFRVNKERSIYGDGVHEWNWPTGYGIHITSIRVNLLKFLPAGASRVAYTNFSFPPGDLHKIKIIAEERNIKVYCDANLLIDFTDSSENPFLNGRIALAGSTGTIYPAEIWYDNVIVRDLEIGPTATPTPTPTPTLEPVVLLPGLGGSWNHEEIFLGINQPQDAWYETPFVTTYDSLIQTLQNAGYSLGENFFIFYYDWFQPINQTADDLENFIETAVNPLPENKINLIGHSLGGLVGRTYIQNNPDSHKVNLLIAVGSPHMGAPQIYYVWEGANLHRLLGFNERVAAGVLIRLRGFYYPNQVQAVQSLIPSLGNLLFTKDYLKWRKNMLPKPEASMIQQNIWLKNLGITPELQNLTNVLIGVDIATPRWLEIIERNKIDQLLGRWEDGKPVDEEVASGDGSVLEESAKLDGANIWALSGFNHGDLIKTVVGQKRILEILGINNTEITEQPSFSFEPALVLTLASPATLRVTDPLGRQAGAQIYLSEIPDAIFSTQEKTIIIPKARDGKYKIEVLGENDGGSYQLLIGQLTYDQDLWISYKGKIKSGDSNDYAFIYDATLQTTSFHLSKLVNLKINSLLHQIRKQKIRSYIKARLTGKVVRIIGKTWPLPMLLNFGMNKRAAKFTEKAIIKTSEAIRYAERSNPDSLPNLREITDLLAQLHQLLGG